MKTRWWWWVLALTPAVSGPFTEMIVDGIEAHDASYVVFGRNPATGALMAWTSEDTTAWREATVAPDLPE